MGVCVCVGFVMCGCVRERERERELERFSAGVELHTQGQSGKGAD